jgi:hypothetical protein
MVSKDATIEERRKGGEWKRDDRRNKVIGGEDERRVGRLKKRSIERRDREKER